MRTKAERVILPTMPWSESSREARRRVIHRLFPGGVPRLWCPVLTHFAARGEFDEPRIRRHLHILAPHVKGILLPGSTGEGWEMSDADLQRLLDVALEAARAEDIRVLIGVLKTDLPGMLQCLDATVDFLKRRTGVSDPDLDFDGVFLVRGAEGDYARWPKSAGGPYDGFLLSTANVFARELDSIMSLLDQSRRHDAEAQAARVSRVVEGCFELVHGFPTGNAFTNANKVLDHLMAHGENGLHREPPLLYSGVRLPAAWIERAATLLRQHALMPPTGYLE